MRAAIRLYVPYCGLAVMEEMTGIKTGISTTRGPNMSTWGQQDLQPHQAEQLRGAAETARRPSSKEGPRRAILERITDQGGLEGEFHD
jgi:hypothetical protein